MKSKMKLTVLVFKMFFTDDLVELTVRETNAHAGERERERKKRSANNIPSRSRMRDRKPVTTDEMYVMLALFMLMEIIQKPTLGSYFQKNCILAAPVLFLWTGLNQSAITCISLTVMV